MAKPDDPKIAQCIRCKRLMTTRSHKTHDQEICHLTSYKLSKVGKQFRCDFCPELRPTRLALLEHMEGHTKSELERAGYKKEFVIKQKDEEQERSRERKEMSTARKAVWRQQNKKENEH